MRVRTVPREESVGDIRRAERQLVESASRYSFEGHNEADGGHMDAAPHNVKVNRSDG
jgi:hypothetical protein